MAPRAAYVCADPGVPVFGTKGCSIHVQEVLRALARRGVAVDLFAARVGGDAPADLSAVTVHALPPLPKGDPGLRERAALSVNTGVKGLLGAAGPFDFVYERYSLWSHAAMDHAADAGVPGLLEVNAPLIEEQALHRGLHDRAGAEAVARRVFRAASAVVAVSEEVARYVVDRGAPAGRVHVIPNGVDPGRFPTGLPPSRPAPPGVFTVGFVGTMRPWHGLPVLLDAVETLHRLDPRVRLLAVGDGPERAAIEADAGRRGLGGAVEFTGAVTRDAVPALLASMDAAVAPYPRDANFYFSPLKVYEYMAAGLPVVASRVGQVAQILEADVTGLLCEPGDAAALAGAIQRLRQDPVLRGRLGGAARRIVAERHTWDAVAAQILVLASGCPSAPRDPSPLQPPTAALDARAPAEVA